ncbi:MAG: cell wall hydrolase, partial [Bacillota bacterium]
SGTALAANPPDEIAEESAGNRTMEVSVEDITAVTEQLEDYQHEIDMLAQLVYAEARGVNNKAERAAVIWCALNRVDAGYFGSSIEIVVKSRSQFAYSAGLPVTEECRSLAEDVMMRWLLEKRGVEDVCRVLPSDYYYFAGRNGHNWFRKYYRSDDYWDWSLPDPYVEPAETETPAA